MKVITYSDPALGVSVSNYVASLLAKLDTTGEIKAKTKLAVQYRSIANIVAAGGVDIALNQVTEILADPRLELIGPLPAPIQRYTNYSAGVVASSAHRSVGQDLIAFLGTPAAAKVMRSNGVRAQVENRFPPDVDPRDRVALGPFRALSG